MGLQSSNSFHFYLLPVSFWPMFLKYQGLGQCAQAPSTESNAIPSPLLPVLSCAPACPLLCWDPLSPPWASRLGTCSLSLSLHSAQGKPFPSLIFPWGASTPRVNPSKKTLEVTLPFTFFTHSCPREKSDQWYWKKNSAMHTHLSLPWPPGALHCPFHGGSTPPAGHGNPSDWLSVNRHFPTDGSAHKLAGGGNGVNIGKPEWNGASQLGLHAALSW